MRRRDFIWLIANTAAWPFAARAQQSMPVVGFLRSTPAAPFVHLVDAFRQGLNEIGYVEGKNVAIEQRWANNQIAQLPALAADLVGHKAVVIVGNGPAVYAARKAASAL